MSRKVTDTTGLSRLYHLNSEPWLDENASPTPPFVQKTKTYPNADRVALPGADLGVVGALAAARHSVRAFQDKPLPLADLALVLRSGYAVLPPEPAIKGQQFLRRPVPSGGGLYPLDLYVLVHNVDGLSPGVYHYDALGDALERLSGQNWRGVASQAFLTWRFADHVPFVICIGAAFERTQTKYGPRGYRYVLLEAGHCAQNMCLAATEQNLSSLCLGGYYDSTINGLVGLDGEKEAIIYAIAFGEES